MFVKFFGLFLLLAFCYVQIGSSLNCYSCETPVDCLSPKTVTCSRQAANATNDHLHDFFTANLTSAVSDNFDCFHHNYTSSVVTLPNITYKGCVYRTVDVCSLTLKPAFTPLTKRSCNKCSGNLCNPAGTFSSSVVTLFASILAVCLYKVLSM